MRIAFIGTGYVGLVSGTCFAEYGNQVYCIDIDTEKIESLKKGLLPIYEPGLKEMVLRNLEQQRLYFTSSLEEAVTQSDLIFLAVGTPDDGQGNADLTSIFTVTKEMTQVLDGYKVIINKSTVPVGTAKKIRAILKENSKHEFDVVSNPEFLREGHALEDFNAPNRIVIGIDNPRPKEAMELLYHPFDNKNVPLFFMSNESAELVKYACNSFLAMKISFANEMANLCDILGADYNAVKRGLGSDERVGEKFLGAGIGYGGSCFPKDVRALTKTAKEYEYPLLLLDEVERINRQQRLRVIELLQRHFQTNDFQDLIFAVWGLAFKPETDDMRDAPSIDIIYKLIKMGATVRVNDPAAHKTAFGIFENKIQYTDMYGALAQANALIILTEWPDFQEPDFAYMKELLQTPVIVDGRNIYDKAYMKKLNFTYYGIGVNSVS